METARFESRAWPVLEIAGRQSLRSLKTSCRACRGDRVCNPGREPVVGSEFSFLCTPFSDVTSCVASG